MDASLFTATGGTHNFGAPRENPLVTLERLRAQSQAYDVMKHDHTVQCDTMEFDEACRLVIEREPMTLTDHAFRQLYAKLGPGHFGKGTAKTLPFDYLQAWSPDIRATVLGMHVLQEAVAHKDWLVRCYDKQARAVLHGTYPTVQNTDMLQALLNSINPDKVPPDMQVVRPYVDPDRLIVRTVWKDTGRPDGGRAGGSYGIGTFLSNDEIGQGRIRVWPLVQQTSCTNSIIFRPLKNANALFDGSDKPYDEEADQRGDFVGISLVHRGDMRRLNLLVKEAILQSLNAGAEYVGRLIEAETQALPDFTDVLQDLGKKFGWTEEQRTSIALGSEGQQTVAGVIRGVTWAAQQLQNPSDQVDMEAQGGAILVNADSLFAKAARNAARPRAEARVR